MAKILDGTALAGEIRGEVTAGVLEMQDKHRVTPGLAAILVGDDPGSAIYVRNKRRACDEAGMFSKTFNLPGSTSQDQVLNLINRLNRDERFHGILVQLPLPSTIDGQRIIEAVQPGKDVDCLHPFNVGRLSQGRPDFLPGTPAGIQQLLLRNGYDPAGCHVVICGRSDIVGKPLASLLMQRQDGANATVTVCHTRTKDLAGMTRQADILVAAMGRPGPLPPTWSKRAPWLSTRASTGWWTQAVAGDIAWRGTWTSRPWRKRPRPSHLYPAAWVP